MLSVVIQSCSRKPENHEQYRSHGRRRYLPRPPGIGSRKTLRPCNYTGSVMGNQTLLRSAMDSTRGLETMLALNTASPMHAPHATTVWVVLASIALLYLLCGFVVFMFMDSMIHASYKALGVKQEPTDMIGYLIITAQVFIAWWSFIPLIWKWLRNGNKSQDIQNQ